MYGVEVENPGKPWTYEKNKTQWYILFELKLIESPGTRSIHYIRSSFLKACVNLILITNKNVCNSMYICVKKGN